MTPEPIKLLLVDDTPENLVALGALLRRPDVELLEARGGAEALELLLVHDVSLALVDVQMPEMDGFELAELMRGAERTKHVPLIFITAGTHDPGRVFKGYETGAVDFLFKPIDPHILRSKVEVFLELARQRRALAHALRLNEMFIGVVGHDLRNPLHAMLAGVELLVQRGADDATLRVLHKIEASGRRMTAMIDQLLDLTRARLTGSLDFVRAHEPIDVRELVQRTIDELHVSHPAPGITLDADGDTTTSGDAERLLQLFSNLLGNALVHGAHDGAIAVRIAGTPEDIVVEIENRGAIPAELLATLFEPFRARGQRNPRSLGLGLGMFISRQIAVAHGGDVVVTSSDGVTIATVRLPRRGDGAERAGPTRRPSRPSRPAEVTPASEYRR
ncbi:MAG TPA: response regulator [Kofleriaceae bacterium]|nr:response regulator [Kofleriaceae bacterium]